MNTRNHRQIRAMKRYARALHLHFEEAAMRWCEIGLAARWAEQN